MRLRMCPIIFSIDAWLVFLGNALPCSQISIVYMPLLRLQFVAKHIVWNALKQKKVSSTWKQLVVALYWWLAVTIALQWTLMHQPC